MPARGGRAPRALLSPSGPESRPHDLAEVAAVLRAAWEAAAGRAYPRQEPRGGPRLRRRAQQPRGVAGRPRPRRRGGGALAARARGRSRSTRRRPTTPSSRPGPQGALADPEARPADGGGVRLARRARRARSSCWAASTSRSARARRPLAALARATALGGADDLAARRRGGGAPAGRRPGARCAACPGPVAALALTPDGRTRGRRQRRRGAGLGRGHRPAPPDARRRGRAGARRCSRCRTGRFLLVGAEDAPLTQWDLASGRARAHVRAARRASPRASRSCRARRLVVGRRLGPRRAPLRPGERPVRARDRRARRRRDGRGRRRDPRSPRRAATARCGSGPSRTGGCSRASRPRGPRRSPSPSTRRRSRVVAAGEDGIVRDWGTPLPRARRAPSRSHAQPVARARALAGRLAASSPGRRDRTRARASRPTASACSRRSALDAAVQALAVAPGRHGLGRPTARP